MSWLDALLGFSAGVAGYVVATIVTVLIEKPWLDRDRPLIFSKWDTE